MASPLEKCTYLLELKEQFGRLGRQAREKQVDDVAREAESYGQGVGDRAVRLAVETTTEYARNAGKIFEVRLKEAFEKENSIFELILEVQKNPVNELKA